MSWASRAGTAALEGFAAWFTSAACVFQTIALIGVWIVVELGVFPRVDPHGFWVLYVLTVYSAVTQPILAFEARRAGRFQEMLLLNQARTMEALLVILKGLEEEILDEDDDTGPDATVPQVTVEGATWPTKPTMSPTSMSESTCGSTTSTAASGSSGARRSG